MKVMTCAQMSGPCDEKIMGNTPDEMMANGMKHLEAKHPDMAKSVHETDENDPMMVTWREKFAADFAAAPEV